MPEIEIVLGTDTAKLIELLKNHDRVLLKSEHYDGHGLIATRKNIRSCAGETTFSEFKRGKDLLLKRYIAGQIRNGTGNLFQSPWLVRIQDTQSDYDWEWTGGETFVLQGGERGSKVVECYLIGAKQ